MGDTHRLRTDELLLKILAAEDEARAYAFRSEGLSAEGYPAVATALMEVSHRYATEEIRLRAQLAELLLPKDAREAKAKEPTGI